LVAANGEVDSVAIARLDRERIFLYPELDERGWNVVRRLEHIPFQLNRDAL
jgi:hypothetical protein